MDHAALTLSVLLRRTPIFGALTDEGFQTLADVLVRRRLAPGDIVFSEGDPGDSLFIVGEGRLGVAMGRLARPSPLGELRPGDVTGEMSCIDPAPRSATVTALCDATVFELTQAGLRRLQGTAPAVCALIVGGIVTQLTARLRDTHERIEQALLRLAGPISGILPRAGANDRPSGPAPQPYRGPLELHALSNARGLSERDLELLLAVAPPQFYPDGALLCVEDRPGAACYFIARGVVEVLKRVALSQRVLATLGAGTIVGQLALVDNSPRSASVRALGDVVALTLSREDFERLIKARSPLGLRFQEQVAQAGVRQLRLATERLSALLEHRPGSLLSRRDPEPLESLDVDGRAV